eukprot:scaffold578_cov167-Amphora_coffeaeformis.AAC.21
MDKRRAFKAFNVVSIESSFCNRAVSPESDALSLHSQLGDVHNGPEHFVPRVGRLPSDVSQALPFLKSIVDSLTVGSPSSLYDFSSRNSPVFPCSNANPNFVPDSWSIAFAGAPLPVQWTWLVALKRTSYQDLERLERPQARGTVLAKSPIYAPSTAHEKTRKENKKTTFISSLPPLSSLDLLSLPRQQEQKDMAVVTHNSSAGDEINDNNSDARRGIELAVAYLVYATIPLCWGRSNGINDILDSIVEHPGSDATTVTTTASLWNQLAPAIRRALDTSPSKSCPLLSTSIVRMMRGLSILVQDANSNDEAGWQDVMDAANDADRAWVGQQRRRYLNDDYNDALHKLTCFTILTACFLATRPLAESAMTSIITQGEALLQEGQENNPRIRDALQQWKTCMQFTPPPVSSSSNNQKNMFHNRHQNKQHQPKPMWREDKTLLDIFFARVCAAVVVCGPDHVSAFSQFLTPYLPDTVDQEVAWRENLHIYKMSKPQTIGVAALPAAALLVADPLLAVVAAVGSVPLTATRHAKVLWTKPLYIFDDEKDDGNNNVDGKGNGRRNFYHWRTVLQTLVPQSPTSSHDNIMNETVNTQNEWAQGLEMEEDAEEEEEEE